MNKMDDFINKRLSDVNAADDGWNVPSDKVWENAKDYLPKPKKRKRRFLFYILTGLLLLTLGYSTGQFLTSSKNPKTVAQKPIESSTTSTDKNSFEGPFVSDKNTRVSNKSTEEPLLNTKVAVEKIAKNRSTRFPSKNSITSFAVINNEKDSAKNEKDSAQNEIVSVGIGASSSRQKIQKQGLTINPDKLIGSTDNRIVKLSEAMDVGKNDAATNVGGSESGSESEYLGIGFSPISLLQIHPLTTDLHKALHSSIIPAPESMKKVIDVFNPERKTQEFGISHSLSAFTFVNSESFMEDLNEYSLGVKYYNFNIEYGKWISTRWRFSTGALFSKINVDLGFKQFFNFEQTEMNQSITTEYGNTVERSSANEAGNIDVTFISGLEPTEGELVNLRGSVDVSLSAIQIPLLLNYHRRKNKFEHFFGGGIAIELIKEGQKNAIIDLYRENQIISSEIEVDDININRLDYSVYGTTGIRYHITDKINTGLNLKVNMSDVVFSSLDLGIYYRW